MENNLTLEVSLLNIFRYYSLLKAGDNIYLKEDLLEKHHYGQLNFYDYMRSIKGKPLIFIARSKYSPEGEIPDSMYVYKEVDDIEINNLELYQNNVFVSGKYLEDNYKLEFYITPYMIDIKKTFPDIWESFIGNIRDFKIEEINLYSEGL